MRLFGGDRMQRLKDRLYTEEDVPLESRILTKSIEAAQKKIEGRNFGIRKHVLQYDDVLSRQREIIYDQRNKVLEGANLKDQIAKMLDDTVDIVVPRYISKDLPEENWNIEGLRSYYMDWVLTPEDLVFEPNSDNPKIVQRETANSDNNPPTETHSDENSAVASKPTNTAHTRMSFDEIVAFIKNRCHELYAKHEEVLGEDATRELERVLLLQNVDEQWMDHIDAMEELKQGINLRAYGQRDPVVEYRVEGFEMFDAMIETIKENTVKVLLSFKINISRMHTNIMDFPQ